MAGEGTVYELVGVVVHLGTSNFGVAEMQALRHAATEPPSRANNRRSVRDRVPIARRASGEPRRIDRRRRGRGARRLGRLVGFVARRRGALSGRTAGLLAGAAQAADAGAHKRCDCRRAAILRRVRPSRGFWPGQKQMCVGSPAAVTRLPSAARAQAVFAPLSAATRPAAGAVARPAGAFTLSLIHI